MVFTPFQMEQKLTINLAILPVFDCTKYLKNNRIVYSFFCCMTDVKPYILSIQNATFLLTYGFVFFSMFLIQKSRHFFINLLSVLTVFFKLNYIRFSITDWFKILFVFWYSKFWKKYKFVTTVFGVEKISQKSSFF